MTSYPALLLRFSAGVAAALLSLGVALAAESVPDGWFLWRATTPVDGSALDLSSLNATPDGKLGRLTVRDGAFVTPDGQRVRLWGCNLAGVTAYPATAEAAEAIAARLAKGGVNIARLHHLDNAWGVGSGGSIWPADRPEHRELDPAQLDKLHRLIARLRDHGVYSNLNLKVSKTLVAADGFAASIAETPQFQKRVDFYDRRMIDLQKDYARRILTTKNPYTGLAPAEDPAVAIVELNNENSLLGFWTRDLGRGLDRFPEPFRGELQSLWNTWLARHYADDAALAGAWAPAARGDGTSLLPAKAVWEARTQPGSAMTLEPGADATSLVLRITAASGTDWHLQASLPGVPVADGAVYSVEFLAKAGEPRKIGVGVGLDQQANPDAPWRSFGLLETVDLGTEWQRVQLVFPAHSVAGAAAALSLNAGQAAGTIWIKDLRVVRDGPGAGLQAGQSARAGSVPIPTSPSARQWADWIQFLADTERTFADEMLAYLRNDLHVQALVLCSQIDYGGLAGMHREQAMDFADSHAYWQHPDFPGGEWNPTRWTIRNSPQIAEMNDRTFGGFGGLASVRVAGKPYTISEYDHPAPTEFACEMYPTFATFACRQDWDGLYPFDIGEYGASNPDGAITAFFDQLHHPAKWGQAPFATMAFRRGLVPPAPVGAELHLGSPLWGQQPHADVLWLQLIPDGPLDFLNVRYAVSDQPGAAGAKATLTRTGRPAAGPAPVRFVTAPQGRVYVVDTEQAAAAVGYVGGGTVEAGALRVACKRFGRDFASITAVALDHAPLRASARVLITVVARAGNQGAVWNEAHNSVGANWGRGPTIAERVPATITLAGTPNRRVFTLAPDGSRVHEVPTVKNADGLTFTVGPNHRTLDYEVVAF